MGRSRWRPFPAISRTCCWPSTICGPTAHRTRCSSRCAAQCPIHWTERVSEYPDERGFWSVTTAEDIHTVSRDWRTYSSAHGVTAVSEVFPVELVQAMFIGMDPPKHDRLKALFQAGFTPKRIAAHEQEIRAIVIDVLDRLGERETAISCSTSPSRRSRA